MDYKSVLLISTIPYRTASTIECGPTLHEILLIKRAMIAVGRSRRTLSSTTNSVVTKHLDTMDRGPYKKVPLDVPNSRVIRDVRMVLMELVEGRSMECIDPSPYSEGIRLETVA